MNKKLRKEHAFLLQQYHAFNSLWESDRRAALKKLKKDRMVVGNFYEFTTFLPQYILKFHFHLVFDHGDNIPDNIEDVMTMMEMLAKAGFEYFIQQYLQQHPTFPVVPGESTQIVSFEAPIIGGDHIIGILLCAHVYGRLSK